MKRPHRTEIMDMIRTELGLQKPMEFSDYFTREELLELLAYIQLRDETKTGLKIKFGGIDENEDSE